MKNKLFCNMHTKSIFLWAILLISYFILHQAYPDYFNALTILNFLFQVPIVGLLALGMIFPFACGKLDLSVVGTAFFTLTLSSYLLQLNRIGIPAALLIPLIILPSLLSGCLLGLINGYAVGFLKLPCSIFTLCSFWIFYNLARQLLNLYTHLFAYSSVSILFKSLSQGYSFGIPNIFLIFLFFCLLCTALLRFTSFGIRAANIAQGKKEPLEKRMICLSYVWSGLCAAACGMLLGSRHYFYSSSAIQMDTPQLAQALLVVYLAYNHHAPRQFSVSALVAAIFLLHFCQYIGIIFGVNPFMMQALYSMAMLAAAAFHYVQRQSVNRMQSPTHRSPL